MESENEIVKVWKKRKKILKKSRYIKVLCIFLVQ